MASADCVISVGFRSSAEPGTTNSVSCSTIVGFASAASPVAWAGREGSRRAADWLPRIDERLLDPRTGCMTTRWYNFLRELADRMGGIQGASIPQVVESVQSTQSQVAVVTNYAIQVADFAQGVADSTSATAQVAQSNGLTGADSIPDVGDPPPRPGEYAL